MISINTAYNQFCQAINQIYDQTEAESIAGIVFEDEFGTRNIERQDEFSEENQTRLKEIEKRLLDHEPVQYILGMADFYGLKFKVNSHVLIPRQETEELVHWVLELSKPLAQNTALKILDIGTGSGCIPIALKKKNPTLIVEALDVSEEALKVAKENAQLNLVDVRFFQSDILNEKLWESLGTYDIIISNPPYIPYGEINLVPLHVKSYEPKSALFVENSDPLIFYKKIAAFASLKLKTNGLLFFETNEFNAAQVVEIIENQGFRNLKLKKDINGKDRMVMGVKTNSNV